MQELGYATSPPGRLFNGIGWFNFGDLVGAIPTPFVVTLSNAIKGGGVLQATFNVTGLNGNTNFVAVVPPTWSGAAFGNTAYLGITLPVCLRMTDQTPIYAQIDVSNVSLINKYGQNINNYNFYFTDSETPQADGPQQFITNGSPWDIFYTLPDSGQGFCTLTGVGTQTVSTSGTGNTPILISTNPTAITQTLTGEGAMSFGMSLTTAELSKVITQRVSPSDQFVLTITGPNSGTTITAGTSTGVQSQGLQLISGNSGTSVFTFNEFMAPGSVYPLGYYQPTVEVSNLTEGGTTLPSTINLGGSVTLNIGDYALVTITNNPVPDTVNITKDVDRDYATVNDILTYSITISNVSLYTVNNVVITDTIPSYSSFVPGSLTLNGTNIPGNPSSGVNIGTMSISSTSTVTFKVLVQSTIPDNNIVSNDAILNYISPLSSRSIKSQIVTTTINYATISSSKSVSKRFASVGDILIYTITIQNTGNTTATNVVFIDTIPNDTVFINGSLTQNGISLVGNPNPPGVLLNNIAPGGTTTIGFNVLINTIPSPNPILNSATTTITFTIDPSINPVRTGSNNSNTNIVSTQVNTATIPRVTKSVDINFATCGSIITYLINVPNNGNVTATNVVISDTVPNGTTLVPGSVLANGVPTGGNPSNINLGNIAPGGTATASFRVQVQC